jgi:hypothetical protein
MGIAFVWELLGKHFLKLHASKITVTKSMAFKFILLSFVETKL